MLVAQKVSEPVSIETVKQQLNMGCSLEVLQEFLYHEDESISEFASLKMAELGEQSVEGLINAVGSETRHVAVHAVRALGIIGSKAKSAIPTLISIMQTSHAELRDQSAAALGRIGEEPETVVPALASLLSNIETSARQYAAAALCEFGKDVALVAAMLELAVNDDDDHVKEFSKLALAQLK